MRRVSKIFIVVSFLVGICLIWVLSRKEKNEGSKPIEFSNPSLSSNNLKNDELLELTDSDLTDPLKEVEGNLASEISIEFIGLIQSDLEDENHSHILREWRGRLTPSINEAVQRLLLDEGNRELKIKISKDFEFSLTVEKVISYKELEGVVTGKIVGDEFSSFSIAYVNSAIDGIIRDYRNQSIWEIRNAGNGEQFLVEVDTEAKSECRSCSAGLL